MATIKLAAGAITTLAGTELNGLGNNAGAMGGEFDNSTGLNIWGLFELNVQFASNPSAGATVDMYIIPAPDGTNYDDAVPGAGGTAPGTSYAGAFPIRAVTTAQKVPLGLGVRGRVELPPTKFKILIVNRTGQPFPSSGSSLRMIPYYYQSV